LPNAELVLELSKSASPAALSNVLLVLCHLFASQSELANIPDEAYKSLAKLPTLTTELLALTRKGTRSQVLITMMATAASRNVIAHDNYLRILQDIIVLVPLGPAAQYVANGLMDLASSVTVKSEQGNRIIAALKILDQRYPEASDKAMQSALDRFKTQGEEGTSGALANSGGLLLEMLQSAFHDSVRAPLLEAGTSLALAIDASSASIRRVALEKLDALAEKDPEALNVLLGSLVRRLTDENSSVVQTALSLRSMSKLPPAAVLESLSLTLSSSLGSALKPVTKKANRADARGVAIKILKFLAGSFVSDNPKKREAVAEQLMTAIFAAPHTRRVAFTAVECASSIGHPLMDGLKGLNALVRSEGTKSSGWTWKEYDEKTHNREVILALGRQAAKDTEALTSLAALLRSEIAVVQQISLLAANVAISLQSKSTSSSTMALEIIKWFMAKGQQGCVQNKDTAQYSNSKKVKALVFESETGVIDVECLDEAFSVGGKLEHEHLVAAVVQNALELVQTVVFSELDRKVWGLPVLTLYGPCALCYAEQGHSRVCN
jgi:hypothetical protein